MSCTHVETHKQHVSYVCLVKNRSSPVVEGNGYIMTKRSDYTLSPGSNTSKLASSLHGVLESERKFNVVIFGLKEPPIGTPKAVRSARDLESSTATWSVVDSNVKDCSIRDCFRLGEYEESCTQPILIRLTRACEMQSILSQRYKLSQSPGISIKPDLSPEEREQ